MFKKKKKPRVNVRLPAALAQGPALELPVQRRPSARRAAAPRRGPRGCARRRAGRAPDAAAGARGSAGSAGPASRRNAHPGPRRRRTLTDASPRTDYHRARARPAPPPPQRAALPSGRGSAPEVRAGVALRPRGLRRPAALCAGAREAVGAGAGSSAAPTPPRPRRHRGRGVGPAYSPSLALWPTTQHYFRKSHCNTDGSVKHRGRGTRKQRSGPGSRGQGLRGRRQTPGGPRWAPRRGVGGAWTRAPNPRKKARGRRRASLCPRPRARGSLTGEAGWGPAGCESATRGSRGSGSGPGTAGRDSVPGEGSCSGPRVPDSDALQELGSCGQDQTSKARLHPASHLRVRWAGRGTRLTRGSRHSALLTAPQAERATPTHAYHAHTAEATPVHARTAPTPPGQSRCRLAALPAPRPVCRPPSRGYFLGRPKAQGAIQSQRCPSKPISPPLRHTGPHPVVSPIQTH